MKNTAPEGRDGKNKKPATLVYSECDFVHSFMGDGIIKTVYKKSFICGECNQKHYYRANNGDATKFTVETKISDIPNSFCYVDFIESKIKAGNQLNLAL